MTKETFIQTMELLQKQPNYESDLARELLNTLKHAFPDVYDWILWWLARQDNYAIWTADETQRRNLGDAASLYNFISTPEARDGTLQGNDIAMLPISMRRLVQIHKIHVDILPRDIPVKLGIQMQQRFAKRLKAANPHFAR